MDAVSPLAGRGREQQRLATLLAAASAGEPGVALIHGEPGIGKTRLAAAVTAGATEATGPGARHVLAGWCLRLTASSAPYLPLVTALDTWLRAHPDTGPPTVAAAAPALIPLLPSLAGDTPGDGGPAAVDGRVLPAWEQALRAVAEQAPAVLVIDDVQWADGSSLDVLSYLAASLAGHRLLVVVTYRDSELPDGAPLHTWLADLHRLPRVHDLPLTRLTEAGTRDQVRLLTGADPDPALVAALHQRSRGNPYLTELLVAHAGADPEEVDTALPEQLRRAVLADWHRLPAPVRDLTRLLAVAGRPVHPDVLARVVASRGDPVEDFGTHLRVAAAAGVLTSDQRGRTWFRHPLIGEALYGELLPGERRALHAAFADGAEPDRSDATALGEHARHCDRAGRADEAFEYLLRAAEAARRIQAYRERAGFYRRAAELWPQLSTAVQDQHGPVVELLLTAAAAVRWAGDEPAALTLVERAREAVDPRADPVTAGHLLA